MCAHTQVRVQGKCVPAATDVSLSRVPHSKTAEADSASKFEHSDSRSASMFNISKAFSSFSVNDIQKAREFYGKTLQ
jgi:hypothetical protein